MKTTLFNREKNKDFELKETIKASNLPLEWTWDKGNCPHCGVKIAMTKSYTIDDIFVYESEDKDTFFLGYTKELVSGGRPLTLRLPDKEFCSVKDMTADIINKSKYLKEKDNG